MKSIQFTSEDNENPRENTSYDDEYVVAYAGIFGAQLMKHVHTWVGCIRARQNTFSLVVWIKISSIYSQFKILIQRRKQDIV